MATITKTVRIEQEMIDIINTYRKLFKKTTGVDISVNQVLSGCIVKGFKDYLEFFKMASIREIKIEGEIITIPDEAKDLLNKYESYYYSYDSDE